MFFLWIVFVLFNQLSYFSADRNSKLDQLPVTKYQPFRHSLQIGAFESNRIHYFAIIEQFKEKELEKKRKIEQAKKDNIYRLYLVSKTSGNFLKDFIPMRY